MCKDILVEPQSQQLPGETLQSPILTGNEVCLDICKRGFWQTGQTAFFYAWVFNPDAKRYVNQDISETYRLNEVKKILYNERIIEIEHGSFNQLVMSATGGMGREYKTFYSCLAEMINWREVSVTKSLWLG